MSDFQKILFSDDKPAAETMPSIVSSRIRLARNLAGYKFVKYACRDDLRHVADACVDVLCEYTTLKNKPAIAVNKLVDYEKYALVEHHLCSQCFVQGTNESRLMVGDKNTTSIMINEEDHLRIQVFGPDLSFHTMFDAITKIDDYICKNIGIAFDEKYGFLTACPTNVGTGMRASVMMHLPALAITKQITNLISAVQRLGFAVRGMFGEGSEARGNFFQISNQQTLGLSEVDILSRLLQIIRSILEYESNAREMIRKEQRVLIYDSIGRAIGILRGCYSIGSTEAINCISLVLLAVEMGCLPQYLRHELNNVMLRTQSAHIEVLVGKSLQQQEIEIRRAEILRKFFSTVPDVKFDQ